MPPGASGYLPRGAPRAVTISTAPTVIPDGHLTAPASWAPFLRPRRPAYHTPPLPPPPPDVADALGPRLNRRMRRAILQPKPYLSGQPPHVTARAAWREWARIGASPWVLGVLREGLLLPWRRRPPPHRARQILVPPDVAAWAAGEVRRWVDHGYARRATPQETAASQWECASFVANVSTKPRLVVDLSPVNDDLYDRHFRYEMLPAFIAQLKAGDHLVSWDVSDAFHHIRLAPRERARLAFRVGGVLYYPLTLPFGLKLAPWALTKLLRPVVAHLRKAGNHVLPYMDDFALTPDLPNSVTREQATAARAAAMRLFARLGLHVHPRKGEREGTKTLEVLGYVVDTDRCLVLLPPRRLQAVVGAAHSLLQAATRDRRWVRTRALQRMCGLAASCSLAVPLARYRLRSLYSPMTTLRGRSRLGTRALEDLRWWAALRTSEDVGRALFQQPLRGTLTTDASSYGWGATLDQTTPARSFFPYLHGRDHINRKELLAIIYALESFPNLAGPGVVRVVTDSRVVQGIVNALSTRSPTLMADVRRLHNLLQMRGLTIEASWLASVENIHADRLSRVRDSADWRLAPWAFRSLASAWGPLTVDRFASAVNTQLPRFYSADLCPGTEGVDAFSVSWRGERNYCNPPFYLVPHVLAKIRAERVSAVVIVPAWDAQPWWRTAVCDAHAAVMLPRDASQPTRPTWEPGAPPPSWRTAALLYSSGGRRATGCAGAAWPTLTSWPPSAVPALARRRRPPSLPSASPQPPPTSMGGTG